MEPELRLRSSEEYGEALRELIERSVTAQVRSSHGVAAMVSGGLDSSGVACVAARELHRQGRRLQAVSSVLPDEFRGGEWCGDERDFIQAVTSQEPNMDPCLMRGDRFAPIDFSDETLERLGQPSRDLFDFRTRGLVAAAEERGARVLLSGQGGDMAASYDGTGRLADLLRRGHPVGLLRQLSLQSRARDVPLLKLLKREVLYPFVPIGVRRWRERRRREGGLGWEGTAIHPDFAARMGLDELLREQADIPLDARREIQSIHSRGFVVYENALIANHCDTIEGREPLMDRRIWEFAYRVPLGEFCEDGISRSLYRRAMSGVLPEKVRRRTTKGWFAPDYRQRMLACRPAIREFLDTHPAADPIWEYVHRPSVESALLRLEQPDPPDRWNVSHQLILGRGLRNAHFLSWLRRTA
jgi:asparagine synthase (glutamine-hydrolysing)